MAKRPDFSRISRQLALAGLLLGGTAALALPKFNEWTTPVNAESLPGSAASLNTPAVDGCVSFSRDGRYMAFNSNRTGNHDIYLATRESVDRGFGAPVPLPPSINTSADEFCPTIAPGSRLYFSRTLPDDPGVLLLSREGKAGWSQPAALGGGINSPLMEEGAAFYEDESGNAVMLFSRREASGAGGNIFVSVNGGAPAPIGGGPDSPASDNRPSVTHDGRTIFFDSTRPGSLGGPDLWYATRGSTGAPFGPAVHLSGLSSAGFDARPSVSWSGTELFFSSNRGGSESAAPDIWRTVRSKTHPGAKVVEF